MKECGFPRDFLLLLCFGRLLVQRQRKEATQILDCVALGIVKEGAISL